MISNREVKLYEPCGSIWHQDYSLASGVFRDRYRVWIVLIENGKTYMKGLIIGGSERNTNAGLLRIIDAMKAATETGPKDMALVEEGGLLPWPE